MPSPTEILEGLTRISNEALPLAVMWHVMLGIGLISVMLGWRPSRRLVAFAMSAPLASVAGFAWAFNSPFNAAVFGATAIAVAAMGLQAATEPIERPRWWTVAVGTLMVVFAWVYPHFLHGHGWFTYLYAAPMGLIPCPTLSAVIGIALLSGGFGRAWNLIVASVGTFYAVFGTLRLGVALDLVLLVGAVALGVVALGRSFSTPGVRPVHG